MKYCHKVNMEQACLIVCPHSHLQSSDSYVCLLLILLFPLAFLSRELSTAFCSPVTPISCLTPSLSFPSHTCCDENGDFFIMIFIYLQCCIFTHAPCSSMGQHTDFFASYSSPSSSSSSSSAVSIWISGFVFLV